MQQEARKSSLNMISDFKGHLTMTMTMLLQIYKFYTLPKLRTSTCQINIFFLQKINNFATIVNERSVLKLFQLSHEDLFFS